MSRRVTKYSIDEVIEILNNKGYKLLSNEYKNVKSKLEIEDEDNYKYISTFNNILIGEIPVKFTKFNPFIFDNVIIFLNRYFPEFILVDILFQNKSHSIRLILKDNDGFHYYTYLSSILNNHKPQMFYKNNPYTIQNIILWCQVNKKPFILLSEKYEKNNKPLKWKCLKESCGEIFYSPLSNIIDGNHGCGVCWGRQVTDANCLAINYPDLLKEWHPKNDFTPYDVVCFSHEKVWWTCSRCGNEWPATIAKRTKNNTGCPACKVSHGEKIIEKWLKNENLTYIHNHQIEECRNVLKLSFDFYLTESNQCIEMQGKQHYQPVNRFGGIEAFEKQQINDSIKRNFCKLNSIHLIEIPYWEFNNIETILKKQINNCQQASVVNYIN